MTIQAKQMELTDVLEVSTNEEIKARTLIGSDHGDATKLRNAIDRAHEQGTHLFLCPDCAGALKLRCKDRRDGVQLPGPREFHFRHRLPNPACPSSKHYAGPTLTEAQMRARQYQGQQEGPLHKSMTGMLLECLKNDPAFTNPMKETRQCDDEDPRRWRCPDVSGVYRGQRVVFEIQLSSTFIDVMAARWAFYHRNDTMLVWVVRDYGKYAKQTHHDAFYPNNHNIFVVSENTLAASIDAGELLLECVWDEPIVRNGRLEGSSRHHDLVPFSGLTWDMDRLRLFHFDYEGARTRAEDQLEAAKAKERLHQEALKRQAQQHAAARQQAERSALRSAFFEHWARRVDRPYKPDARYNPNPEWAQLRKRLWDQRIFVGEKFEAVSGLIACLLDTRDFDPAEGGLRYSGYDGPRALFNHFSNILCHGNEHFHRRSIYLAALKGFGRESYLSDCDRKGNWLSKVARLQKDKDEHDHNHPATDDCPFPDDADIDLVCLLFPELVPLLKDLPTHESVHGRSRGL